MLEVYKIGKLMMEMKDGRYKSWCCTLAAQMLKLCVHKSED